MRGAVGKDKALEVLVRGHRAFGVVAHGWSQAGDRAEQLSLVLGATAGRFLFTSGESKVPCEMDPMEAIMPQSRSGP